jgi:hypothetical protein
VKEKSTNNRRAVEPTEDHPYMYCTVQYGLQYWACERAGSGGADEDLEVEVEVEMEVEQRKEVSTDKPSSHPSLGPSN